MLEQQVGGCSRDRRSQALVDNFASQWLKLGNCPASCPDVDAFPDFDENLREAMRQETRLFVDSQLREDRSVDRAADGQLHLRQRAAGAALRIPNVYGSHFRRVTFADGTRGGLLGQGSILTVTSYPNRTSPVLRGRWLLENMLGAPPPPPPPDVPALTGSGPTARPPLGARAHGSAPQEPGRARCATCGWIRWASRSRISTRSASGGRQRRRSRSMRPRRCPTARRFKGVAGLRQLLLSHRGGVRRARSREKLLAYALGRGVESYDLPAVRQIARDAAAGDYRWSSLIMGIVQSTPFR